MRQTVHLIAVMLLITVVIYIGIILFGRGNFMLGILNTILCSYSIHTYLEYIREM